MTKEDPEKRSKTPCRDRFWEALEDFLTSNEGSQVFIVEGKRGSGKNTACEHVISKIQKRAAFWNRSALIGFICFIVFLALVDFWPFFVSFLKEHTLLRWAGIIVCLIAFVGFVVCLLQRDRHKYSPFGKYASVFLYASPGIEDLENKISDATVNIWNAGKNLTFFTKFFRKTILLSLETIMVLLGIFLYVKFFHHSKLIFLGYPLLSKL